MRLACLLVACTALPAAADDAPPDWRHGDHLTGEWAGKRTKLADHGVTIDVVYATEAFEDANHGAVALSHLDAALTLDTEKLGLWSNGTFYVLGQNGTGTGIDDRVGSVTTISNLEGEPYTQLTELLFDQTLGPFEIRVGKQDANRDFGTPRFGGNFLNNNFGMFPNAPLPSYPTTGLGAALALHAAWLTARAAIYEGSPDVGGLGLDTAFRDGAGHTAIGGLAATRHWGPNNRDDGTTSIGVWHQTGDFADLLEGEHYSSNDGFFIQHDEHIYFHPLDADDPRGLTVILRFSWARPDRTQISRYAGGSIAWHGVGARTDDTVGLGVGYLALGQSLGGTTGAFDEWFVEASYKLRLTKFASLQPDVEVYRHPGGDGADALIAGGRLKVKL